MVKAEGFEPRFDLDMGRGEVGERLVELFFADSQDESTQIEIKTDYRANETGNWYVETHKYRDGNVEAAVPSGINGTKSDWWIQASPTRKAFVVINTDELRNYIDLVDPPQGSQSISNSRTAASLGRKVNIRGLMRYLGLGNGK